VARVVAGEENSADTYRNLYRHTLAPLKSNVAPFVRLDHRGKDAKAAGARARRPRMMTSIACGSSVNRRGPDGESYITLRLGKAARQRAPRANQGVARRYAEAPTRREGWSLADSERQRIGECIEAMKSLGLPTDIGRPKALKALRENGYKVRSDTVMAA